MFQNFSLFAFIELEIKKKKNRQIRKIYSHLYQCENNLSLYINHKNLHEYYIGIKCGFYDNFIFMFIAFSSPRTLNFYMHYIYAEESNINYSLLFLSFETL